MHPCLCVDEILRHITCELVASGGRATSVALACCCKCFEDPALDVLWGTQDLLLPLLKSLPRDVWNGTGCTSFKRIPTAPEWARFRKYARRMRKLAVLGLKNVPSSKMYSVLQLCAINEPLLPNLKTLDLCPVTGEFISCIPFLLSPRTTAISIMFIENDVPTATFASVATALPTLCPNLEELGLHYLPDDPITVAAVSEMLLAANRNTLKSVMVDCPLAVEAREVIYKLSSLYGLMVVIERDTLLPPIVLPNLTKLDIKGNYGGEQLRKFHGAVLGKLESITFSPESESERLGDFLEAFERIALATSAQNTLSEFCLYTLSSWRPNYSSLLSFTHLTILVIESSCDDGCSSITDDDVITDLARAMPKLETLQLGDTPCQPTGVTVKGFVALSHHCLDLSTLCVHFQVASLSAPPEIGGMASNSASTNFQRRDCALTGLDVGSIRVPGRIEHVDRNWGKVMNAVRLSRKIVDCSRVALESRS